MTLPPAADPVAILLEEHTEAVTLFDALDRTLAALSPDDSATVARALKEVRRVLAYLSDGLELHIRKEEEPLFPLLKAALPAGDRLIDEMVAEHDQARMRRDQLRAVLDELLAGHSHEQVREQRAALAEAVGAAGQELRDPARLASVRRAWSAVRETLRVHFQNEEEIVFPLVPELLTEEQRAGAVSAMDAIARAAAEIGAARPRAVVVHPLQQADELLATPQVQRDGRTARTLVKDGPLRVLLVALRAGGQLKQHHAPGPVSIHVIRGTVVISTPSERYQLQAGDLLHLPARVMHRVDAATDAALLITIAGPE